MGNQIGFFCYSHFKHFALNKAIKHFAFKKQERLKSRKIIGSLFVRKPTDNAAFVFPIKAVFLEQLALSNEPLSNIDCQAEFIEAQEANSQQGSAAQLKAKSQNDPSYLIPHTSYLKTPQVLFSVSKRNFKHAVERNLIRRRMKEAYRLNKSLLINNFPAYIAFIYVAKEAIPFQNIEKSIKTLLKKLNR